MKVFDVLTKSKLTQNKVLASSIMFLGELVRSQAALVKATTSILNATKVPKNRTTHISADSSDGATQGAENTPATKAKLVGVSNINKTQPIETKIKVTAI